MQCRLRERERLVDISEGLKNAVGKWDARIFILVSLLLQVILILLATRRQRSTSKALRFFIWSSYLLADWAAGFALGLLCKSQVGFDCDAITSKGNALQVDDHPIISTSKHKLSHGYDNNLLAFWAPFLLLHLGGPDNITAFSLEDNSLWPRRLVGLLFQVVTAVYVVLLSLPHNRLLTPTICMFLAGIIKCSERTVALYFASSNAVIPWINYPRDDRLEIWKQGSKYGNYNVVLFAYDLVEEHKVIIAERRPYKPPLYCDPFGQILEGKQAFDLIEWELSFLYDSLFTKATVVHSCIGFALRVLCSSLILAASILFFLSSKHDFMRLDVSITYVLLAGAISLDVLGYIMLIFSKWTIVRLKEFESRFMLSGLLIEYIAPIIYKVVSTSNDWSGLMMQQSLINDCLHQISHFDYKLKSVTLKLKDFILNSFFHQIFYLDCKLESTWSESVTSELKDFILEYVRKRLRDSWEAFNSLLRWDELQHDCYEMLSRELQKLPLSRGNLPLENMNEGVFRKSVDCKFEESVIIWHLATDLCCYTEGEGTTIGEEHRNLSKLISNYMVYLLCRRPSLMPSVELGVWQKVYKDTHDNILYVIKSRLSQESKKAPNILQQFEEACNEQRRIRPDRSSFWVLETAVTLARDIQASVNGDIWRKVAEVWVDMLLYVANDCSGIELAQSLSRGGQLLASVSFLLNHYCQQRGADFDHVELMTCEGRRPLGGYGMLCLLVGR